MMASTRVRTGHMMSASGDASGHSCGGREIGMSRWAFVEDTIQAWCMRIRCAGADITAWICVPRTYTPQYTGTNAGGRVSLSVDFLSTCPLFCVQGSLTAGRSWRAGYAWAVLTRSLFCACRCRHVPDSCLGGRGGRTHAGRRSPLAELLSVLRRVGVNVNVCRRWEDEWWMAKAEFEAKEGHVCCRCENHSAISMYHPPLHACSREDGGLGETCTAGGDSGSEHMRARIGRPAARPVEEEERRQEGTPSRAAREVLRYPVVVPGKNSDAFESVYTVEWRHCEPKRKC